MPSKRSYRRISVKQIDFEKLRERAVELGGHRTCVGLDIAKSEIVAVVRWPDGQFEAPWKAGNPSEIGELMTRLQVLREVCDSLTVALESTGTYGDAVRLAMTQAGLDVQRISGKAVADYQEIFDGTPSQHDGKDAAMIAELAHFGKGRPWPYTPPSQAEDQMRFDVARYRICVDEKTRWSNRIEAILARHWPELGRIISPSSSTALQIFEHYGSPAQLAADKQATANLRRWSRGALGGTKIRAILKSARTTCGLPMSQAAIDWLGENAREVGRLAKRRNELKESLRKMALNDPAMSPLVDSTGPVTLCAIWSTVGDPGGYDSAGAFIKAIGLNLKESSSGKHQGQLKITKRGPSDARKVLYYWALRTISGGPLKAWYGIRINPKLGGEKVKMKMIIALMRRLAAGLWHARRHGEAFDEAKVFPGRPLVARSNKRRRRRRRRNEVAVSAG